ncbi:shikimate kinase [Candidatus Daviesbacteria bacterium]|nr:shikimate kinase [Candidatus Daviesbacteria bacterium]
MKIILIGFMGSGKTTVGKELAKRLGVKLIDTDSLVIRASGRKSIKEIFQKDGEIRFRELEIEVAKEVAMRKEDLVVATGGGVVLNKIILDYLKKEGVVVYLEASFKEIAKRLEGFKDRPLFKNLKDARRLYLLRKILYRSYKDIKVFTNNKDINEIVDNIMKKIRIY